MSQEYDLNLLYDVDMGDLPKEIVQKVATKCKQSQGTIASSGECTAKPVGTLIYSTRIDEDYIITTQVPLCQDHLDARVKAFERVGYPYKLGSVSNGS